VVLDAVGHSAGMGAVIDLEGVGDAVTVEDVVQLTRVDPQAVLVAHIHGDGAVLAQIADVLVDEGERRIGGPFGDHIGLGHAVLGGKVKIERRILRVGRPCGCGSKLGAQTEGQAGRVRGRLHCFEGLVVGRVGWAADPRGHATWAHDIEAAEDVGMLHADAAGAIASHGMADQAAGEAVGDGAVMRVDIGDDVVGDVLLEVAGGDGTGVHRSVVHGLGVGQHYNHFFGALGERALDGLGHMNFVAPLFGSDGIAVQGIHHGIAARLVGGVAGRQEDEDVAIDGVAFEISFECGAMNFDVLDGDRLRAGYGRRHLSLDLGESCCSTGEGQGRCESCCTKGLRHHGQCSLESHHQYARPAGWLQPLASDGCYHSSELVERRNS
jgi:hypothetical protein